ncbi:MAG: 3-keto-5-aminohexanoate cleavage protein [Rhodospirillales bacterium]
MEKKTIVSCAVTGNITTRDQHPNLPVTPEEIANAAVGAWKEGAGIVHCHVRDPETHLGSMDINLYKEVIDRIRDAGSDVIINLTTGEGGRFIPSDDEPRVAGPGTTLCRPELRVQHVKQLKPEICTLDFNTMVNGNRVVINTPPNLEIMANTINEAGTKPELEIFDSGDLNMANDFIKRGILKSPAMFQLVLGIRWGAAPDFDTLAYLVKRLPADCEWAAFGVGRFAFKTLAMAYLLGGHVRIGMEDVVHIRKGELCRDNAQLVEKAVGIVESLGGEIATPTEARKILKLS